MLFTTLKPHRYGGVMHNPGDEYDIPGQSDARLYKALGWVVEAPEKVAVVVADKAIRRAPMVVAPAVESVAAPAITVEVIEPESADPVAEVAIAEVTKRAYKRRDLSAE